MDIVQILQFLYPDAIAGIDYQVGDDGTGPRIVSWSYEKAPQPDDATLTGNAEEASNAAAWSVYRMQAQKALQESDVTIIRCYENAVAVPPAWATYRKLLRGIVGSATGDPTATLPSKPQYPANT